MKGQTGVGCKENSLMDGKQQTWWLSQEASTVLKQTRWKTIGRRFSTFSPRSFKRSWHRFRVDRFSPRNCRRLSVRQRVADVNDTAAVITGEVQTRNGRSHGCLGVFGCRWIVYQTKSNPHWLLHPSDLGEHEKKNQYIKVTKLRYISHALLSQKPRGSNFHPIWQRNMHNQSCQFLLPAINQLIKGFQFYDVSNYAHPIRLSPLTQ